MKDFLLLTPSRVSNINETCKTSLRLRETLVSNNIRSNSDLYTIELFENSQKKDLDARHYFWEGRSIRVKKMFNTGWDVQFTFSFDIHFIVTICTALMYNSRYWIIPQRWRIAIYIVTLLVRHTLSPRDTMWWQSWRYLVNLFPDLEVEENRMLRQTRLMSVGFKGKVRCDEDWR